MTHTTLILILTLVLVLLLLVDYTHTLITRYQERARKNDALLTLKRHGLIPQRYLDSTGQEDMGLRFAIDVFASSGYIITDADGNVAGKLLPEVEF